MKTINEAKVKRWMRRALTQRPSEYIDECNEVNATKLGEDCANDMDLYEEDSETIPEVVFDAAAEAAVFAENK